jgi:hypothetical protein
MPLFTPPDPVTIGFVGVCSAIPVVPVKAVFTRLPESLKRHKTSVSLILVVLGGAYGLVVWVQALMGDIEQPGRLFSQEPRAYEVVLGPAGLMGLIGAGYGLFRRWVLREEHVKPDEKMEWLAGIGFVIGIVLCLVVPGVEY